MNVTANTLDGRNSKLKARGGIMDTPIVDAENDNRGGGDDDVKPQANASSSDSKTSETVISSLRGANELLATDNNNHNGTVFSEKSSIAHAPHATSISLIVSNETTADGAGADVVIDAEVTASNAKRTTIEAN